MTTTKTLTGAALLQEELGDAFMTLRTIGKSREHPDLGQVVTISQQLASLQAMWMTLIVRIENEVKEAVGR